MPADAPGLAELAALQRRMLLAVHGDPEAFAATAGLLAQEGIAAEKRLFLHLNTVRHALVAVLRQAYPATARLLGEEVFAAAAGAFLRACPPEQPRLSLYGARFDDFLVREGSLAAPLAAVPRLDRAAQEAYFAADAPALAAADLTDLPEASHAGLRLAPVPSARLLPLPAAAWERWAGLVDRREIALLEPGGPGRPPTAGALVWRRPDLAVAARPLTGAELRCLNTLAGGATLLEAAMRAGEPGADDPGADDPGAPRSERSLDLGALLTDALAGGVFRALACGGP
jgi:hypothetical protein